jgi:hypothetical protein
MRIKRIIIIVPAVLALTTAGSALAGATVSASAAQVHSVATSTNPGTHYHA